MTRNSLRTATVMLVVAVVTTVVTSAEEPDQQKMMEMIAKYATPGEHHALLEPVVGSWTAASQWWAAPGAKPLDSYGKSENTWVLGNRFVQQRYTGSFMGQAFEGLGFTGYDNHGESYVGLWMDSMGTMMMVSTGTAEEGGKVMTFTSEVDDYMSGTRITVRTVLRIVDDDHHVFEMYVPGPDGEEFKNMVVKYSRGK